MNAASHDRDSPTIRSKTAARAKLLAEAPPFAIDVPYLSGSMVDVQ